MSIVGIEKLAGEEEGLGLGLRWEATVVRLERWEGVEVGVWGAMKAFVVRGGRVVGVVLRRGMLVRERRIGEAIVV